MDDFELFGAGESKREQNIYGDAFVEARKEFAERGITHPTGKTAGFRERVQEIYKNLMGDSYKPVYYSSINKNPLPKNIQKTETAIYSVEEIIKKSEIWEKEQSIKSLPGKTYGGYAFSLAQMETVKGLPDKQLDIIGKTMTAALAAKKRKYQIKQDLFMNVINWDNEFFVELAFADSYFLEKPLILSFYQGFEFDNEADAINEINQSEYLKHYPELKNDVLENALYLIKICKKD